MRLERDSKLDFPNWNSGSPASIACPPYYHPLLITSSVHIKLPKEGPRLKSVSGRAWTQTTTSSFTVWGSYQDTETETSVRCTRYPDSALSHGDTTASVELPKELKFWRNTSALVWSKAAVPLCSSLPEASGMRKMLRAGNIRSASKKLSSHKQLTAVLQQEVPGKPHCRQYCQTLFLLSLPVIHHQKKNRGISQHSWVPLVFGPHPLPVQSHLRTGRPCGHNMAGQLPHTDLESNRVVLAEWKAVTATRFPLLRVSTSLLLAR